LLLLLLLLRPLNGLPALCLPLPLSQPKAPGGFGVLHLLIVALLAFLVGHFANVAVPMLSEKLGLAKQQ